MEDNPSGRRLFCLFYIPYNQQKSPGQLVFGQDMIAPIDHVANWSLISKRKQQLIDKSTDQENSTRSKNHFRVGDKVLIRNNQGKKYEAPYKGPYTSIQMWTNGVVTLRMGSTKDRLNILCLKPYYI